jgi:4-hydroxythreonine-4-phosphate dehydrogenase
MVFPVVGITMGDPTGIGPEIIVKTLIREEPFQACRPVVLGDPDVLLKTIENLGLPAAVEIFEKVPQEGYRPGKIFVHPLSQLDAASLTFGKPGRGGGEAMVKYIQTAVKWALAGEIDAITTCPISKEAINEAGCLFPGHTEFLGHLAGVPSVAMMFVGPRWKVVLVTTHLPLREVARSITRDRVLATIRLTDDGLKKLFCFSRPRMAVLGLNPHCGEGGLLGEEEKNEILPAIEEAKSLGMVVEGPFPADSFFDLSGHLGPFDAVIPMYHDQGLIPVKMSDFRESTNLTLGLPFIRTSVAHGTAYDIAGKGVADPTNLIRAIQVAANLSKFKSV